MTFGVSADNAARALRDPIARRSLAAVLFLSIFFAASFPSSVEAQPWFERAPCKEASDLALATEFVAAETKLAPLEASKDLDDQACGVWLRVGLSELKIAVLGGTPENLAARKKALSHMYGFAKTFKSRGARFLDLEYEARLRRVRVLLEEGESKEALSEAKIVQKMIADRPKAAPTPTLDYSIGVLNAALASPGWAARALLSVAGLDSDKEVGAAALNKLSDGNSLYKWDAIYVAHHFAREVEGAGFRAPSAYSQPLLERFPTNPQFVFDVAADLWREKKYSESLKVAERAAAQIDAAPSKWSAKIRAKIYWIAGRSALDRGDRAEAKRRAELAKAQNFEELEDQIDDLFDDLEG